MLSHIVFALAALFVGQFIGNVVQDADPSVGSQIIGYLMGCVVLTIVLLGAWGLSGMFV